MPRSVPCAPLVAVALAVLALAPVSAGAAGDPPKPGGGSGAPGPGTKSGLPSSNPGDVGVKPKPDLYVSAIGYSGGAVSFVIRNQGPGAAEQSKWRMRCALDANQPARCAVSFKPSENAGPLQVCPGFASLSPEEGVTPALASGQVFGHGVSKPFKAGCRYKITIEADAAKQVTESNEGNNSNAYVLVGK